MHDLTTIQLMNEMVGSNLGSENGPRIGLRKACSQRVVRRARLLYSTETDDGVFYDELDWLLQEPITHGEWEARQKAAEVIHPMLNSEVRYE